MIDQAPTKPPASVEVDPAIRKARAYPTKAFFVRMLTRDISLDDCVLDLVDNSIDGAWKLSGKHPSGLADNKDLKAYWIQITFTDEEFRIEDNCGGINLDDAANYAFTFGRLQKQVSTDYSVGVYGIGMKRAAFKIGNYIAVDSTYLERKELKAFRVPIVVDQWLKDARPDWDFDLEAANPASTPGVSITISDLSPETHTRLADPLYAKHLRQILARDYALPLMRGLSISLNGAPIIGNELLLKASDQFSAAHYRERDGSAAVELFAGMWTAPPDSNEPDTSSRHKDDTSGWHIVCNGRVVLAADRTATTGWGVNKIPRWHYQYSGFLGVVFFSSKDPMQLPMTTTKHSVDVSSPLYQRALLNMAPMMRDWVTYTNKRKKMRGMKDLEEAAAPVALSRLPINRKMRLPMVSSGPLVERPTNIIFPELPSRISRLKTALGDPTMENDKLGSTVFTYAYDNLVDEDAD